MKLKGKICGKCHTYAGYGCYCCFVRQLLRAEILKKKTYHAKLGKGMMLEIHILDDTNIIAFDEDGNVIASGWEHALDEAFNEQFAPALLKWLITPPEAPR